MRIRKDVIVLSDLEEQVWVEEQEMCFPIEAVVLRHLLFAAVEETIT